MRASWAGRQKPSAHAPAGESGSRAESAWAKAETKRRAEPAHSASHGTSGPHQDTLYISGVSWGLGGPRNICLSLQDEDSKQRVVVGSFRVATENLPVAASSLRRRSTLQEMKRGIAIGSSSVRQCTTKPKRARFVESSPIHSKHEFRRRQSSTVLRLSLNGGESGMGSALR
jgi:hypothetical protein